MPAMFIGIVHKPTITRFGLIIKKISDIINSKDNPIENLNKPVLPKITSPIKLVIELYKAHGIRSMYRGGTLLMLRFK